MCSELCLTSESESNGVGARMERYTGDFFPPLKVAKSEVGSYFVFYWDSKGKLIKDGHPVLPASLEREAGKNLKKPAAPPPQTPHIVEKDLSKEPEVKRVRFWPLHLILKFTIFT